MSHSLVLTLNSMDTIKGCIQLKWRQWYYKTYCLNVTLKIWRQLVSIVRENNLRYQNTNIATVRILNSNCYSPNWSLYVSPVRSQIHPEKNPLNNQLIIFRVADFHKLSLATSDKKTHTICSHRYDHNRCIGTIIFQSLTRV